MAEEQHDDDTAALGNDDTQDNGGDDNAPQLSEVEQLAHEMGWTPKDQYKGDPEKWKEARDWIKVEKDISRQMRDSVKRLNDRIDRMASASTKATERALAQQAEELNRQFAEAVENKDVAGAAKATQGLRELEQSARSDTANIEDKFARDNPWYNPQAAANTVEAEATAYAITISQRLHAQGKSFDEQLEAAEAGVKKRFPELFDDAPQQRQVKAPPSLHSPTGRPPAKKAKTFADLPADVKRAAENHAKLAASRFGVDPEKAKADYATDYFADEQAA